MSRRNQSSSPHSQLGFELRKMRGKVDDDRGLKVDLPEFNGSSDPNVFINWLHEIERVFEYKGYDDVKRCKVAIRTFKGYASQWWDYTRKKRECQGKATMQSWEKLKWYLKKRFLPDNHNQGLHTQIQNPHRPPPHYEYASLEQAAMRLRFCVTREKLRSFQEKWGSRDYSRKTEVKEEKCVEENVEEANNEDVIVSDRVVHTHDNLQEKAQEQEQESVASVEEVLEKVDEDHVLVLPRMLQSQVANEDGDPQLRADLFESVESEDKAIREASNEEEVRDKSERIIEEFNIGEMIVPTEMYHTELNTRQGVKELCATKGNNSEFVEHGVHERHGFKRSTSYESKENEDCVPRTQRDCMVLQGTHVEDDDVLNLRTNSLQSGEYDPFRIMHFQPIYFVFHVYKILRPNVLNFEDPFVLAFCISFISLL